MKNIRFWTDEGIPGFKDWYVDAKKSWLLTGESWFCLNEKTEMGKAVSCLCLCILCLLPVFRKVLLKWKLAVWMNQPWFEACSCCSKPTQLGWFQWKEFSRNMWMLSICSSPWTLASVLYWNKYYFKAYARSLFLFLSAWKWGICWSLCRNRKLYSNALYSCCGDKLFLSEKVKNHYVFHAVQKNPHFVLPYTPQTASPFPPP